MEYLVRRTKSLPKFKPTDLSQIVVEKNDPNATETHRFFSTAWTKHDLTEMDN